MGLDKSMRDSNWTLFNKFVPEDLVNLKDLNERNRYTLKSDVAGAIANGFDTAAADMGILNVETSTYGSSVSIHLPPVTFVRQTYDDNLATITVTNPVSGSLRIELTGSPGHPHCDSHGDFCWSSGVHILELIRREKFEMALIALIDVTTTYIPATSFRIPSGTLFCRVPGCRRKGAKIDPSLDLDRGTADYKSYVCEIHSNTCQISGCKNSAQKRFNSLYVCDHHMEENTCDNCGAVHKIQDVIFNRTMSDPRNIAKFCVSCARRCAGCNKIIPVDNVIPFEDAHFCENCFVFTTVRRNVNSTIWINSREAIVCQENQSALFLMTREDRIHF